MDSVFSPDSPLQFIAWFICLWIIISICISLLGGWWNLAQYYRASTYHVRKSWRFQTGAMRFMTGYGNCLDLGVTEGGLVLTVLFLFRAGHPALLIPWDDITVEKYRSRLFQGMKLHFNKVPGVPLYLRRSLVEKINDEIDGRWNDALA